MFRFKKKLYVEPSNVKKSWNKIWPEWWNTSTVEKSRYSGKVSVPIVAVNVIFHSFSRWVALSSVVIFHKIVYDLLRVIGLKLFSVGGPAKIRNLDGRTTFSVRLGFWLTRLTVRIEPLTLSDHVEFFPIHVFYHDGQIWRPDLCFSSLIITKYNMPNV